MARTRDLRILDTRVALPNRPTRLTPHAADALVTLIRLGQMQDELDRAEQDEAELALRQALPAGTRNEASEAA